MEKSRNAVYHNGKIAYYLNERLAHKQGITDQDMANLVKLHQEKLDIFDQMRATTHWIELRRLAGLVETLEFDMQRIWRFPMDKNFHEWYKVPNCTCPKMDNEDRRGTPYRVFDQNCPIHGNLVDIRPQMR